MSGSNIFRQTPGRVLLAFAVAAALIAVYTAVDASRRGYQEGYDFPTGLGDSELFPAGEGLFDPAKVAFQVDGRPYYQQKRGVIERYDKYMFKSGREDGDRFYVYRYRKSRGRGKSPQGHRFVKVGEREYLEFADRPAALPEGGADVAPPAAE